MAEQILYWLEQQEKWKSRGYANNKILYIDYDNRTFRSETGTIHPKGTANTVQITDKGSIKQYSDYLKRHGFTEGSST